MSEGSGEGLPSPTTSADAQFDSVIRWLRAPVDEAIAQGKVGTPEIYQTMNTVFPLLHGMGFVDEAVRLCRDAMVVSARALWSELVQMTAYGRRNRLRDHRTQVDQFLSNVLDIFPGSGPAARLALDVLLWRRHFGLEIERLGRTLARDDSERNERLSDLAGFRREYAESVHLFPVYPDYAQPRPRHRTRIFLEPVSSRPELDELWAAAYSDLSFDQYADSFPPATAGRIAERLPPGRVLVEYWRAERFFRDAQPQTRYVAIALESGGDSRAELVDLCSASELEEGLVSDYLSAVTGYEASVIPSSLRDDAALRHAASQDQAREVGGRLREVVFDRLPAFARESHHILIVPDGVLYFVPFAALPSGSGGYLVDDHLISHLHSGREVCQASPKRQANAPVVICAPDYEATPPGVALPETPVPEQSRTLRWQPLPWAAEEGRSVAALLGVSPIMGEDANDSALRACASPLVLHVATHGAMLPAQWQTVEISALHASDAPVDMKGVSTFDEGLGRLAGHLVPYQEVRSVLALAGANSWLDGVDLPVEYGTGHVNAEGLLDIELGGTELVVLSACETALGNLYHDEGVVGLRSSLRLAGTRTLVIALWTVPDAETRDLMADYYSNLLNGLGRAEALRHAQLAMRERFPLEPYSWGAFVSEGETGPSERPSTPLCCRLPAQRTTLRLHALGPSASRCRTLPVGRVSAFSGSGTKQGFTARDRRPLNRKGGPMALWVWILVAIVAVAGLVLIAWSMSRRQRSRRLRSTFGPEYERAVRTSDRRDAESELEARQARRRGLDIRPLEAAARQRYAEAWRETQASFVDSPPEAIRRADKLVTDVMEERGYPMENFEQRAGDVSVDHPHLVESYRAAHAISLASAHGKATTEDHGQAMVHYRELFEELLVAPEGGARETG